MKKRILAGLLILCMTLPLLPVTVLMASAVETVGTRVVGPDTEWELVGESGSTKTYHYYTAPPEYCNVEFSFDTETGTILFFGYYGDYNIDLTVPSSLEGVSVTSIKSMKSSAGSDLLTAFTVPSSVKAFGGCGRMSNLTNVIFQGQIDNIDDNAFANCTSLEAVSFRKAVTTIGESAFEGCSSLKRMDLLEGLTSIGYLAFKGCDSLTNITIPASLTSAYGAFANSGLTSVTFADGYTSISELMFWNCKNLEAVNFNDGLAEIGKSAFSECTGLSHVDIPSSVKKICTAAFNGCSNLTGVTLPNRNDLEIEPNSFLFSGITSLTIPNGMTTIPSYAFQCCKDIVWVGLPKSLTKVEYNNFSESTALTDVYFAGSEEEWKAIDIEEHNDPLKNATIHYNSNGPDNPIDPAVKLNLNITVNIPDVLSSANDIPIDVKVEARDIQSAETLTVELDTSLSNGYLTIQDLSGNIIKTTHDISLVPTSYQASQPKWYLDANVNSTDPDKKICFEISVYRNYDTENQELLFNQDYSILNTIDPTDTDGDGLPDVWEMYGVDTNNDGMVDLPIHEWGADRKIEDIFVEVDWMNKPSPGKLSFSSELGGPLGPTKSQLQTVYDVFKKQKINIHIDAGSNSVGFESVSNWASHSGSNEIPYTKVLYVGTESNGYQEWITIANENFDSVRRSVFRHCMFVYQYTEESSQVNHPWSESCTSSGIANDIPGQYFIVAAQTWWKDSQKYDQNVAVPSTFMHELGHTLGLYHGGQDKENYKPNYLSIMNYSFQFEGLYPTHEINYSEYVLNDIDENAIDEFTSLESNLQAPTGLGTKWYRLLLSDTQTQYTKVSEYISNISQPIDYNKNGTYDASYNYHVNQDGSIDANGNKTVSLDVLKSYTDWDKLIYKGGSIGNTSATTVSNSFNVYTEPGLTLQEAIKSDLIDDPGAGRVHFSGPFTLIYTSKDQKLFFDVENYRLQDEDFLLVVNESSLVKRAEIPVHAAAATELQSSTRVEIPVKSELAVGTYPLEYSLINTSTGDIVYNGSTTVDVYNPTAVEISEFLNNPPAEDADPDLQKQLTQILNDLQASNPNTPANPNQPSSPSGSGGSDSSEPAHSISVPSGLAGGKVSVTPTAASVGQRVTVTVTPNTGYELDKLSVTDSKGKELALTDKGNGKYTFTMPNGKVSIDAAFKHITAFTWNNPFADVAEGAWYYDAVKFVNQQGMMNGISGDLFAPDSKLTRAMLAQILYNKAGRPSVAGDNIFIDVSPDSWYANALNWAVRKGIVTGYGNGKAGPNDFITREQLAAILWRYEGRPVSSYELQFTDTDRIANYALDAVRWAAENGIVHGYGDGRLAPNDNASRAHVAQMLKNCFDK